jgi:hypothetical protein
MSNNKQSSVEWLVSSLLQYIHEAHHPEIVELYEQAKAMHQSQTIDFANDLLAQNDSNYIAYPNLAEKYYNETFGGNNEQQ